MSELQARLAETPYPEVAAGTEEAQLVERLVRLPTVASGVSKHRMEEHARHSRPRGPGGGRGPRQRRVD